MSTFAYELTGRPVYKYELTREYEVMVPRLRASVKTPWYEIEGSRLRLPAGFHWNGASGPALDTVTIHRASCVHDALYQAIEQGELPYDPNRKIADQCFKQICLEDGMNRLRAAWCYAALRLFGHAAV